MAHNGGKILLSLLAITGATLTLTGCGEPADAQPADPTHAQVRYEVFTELEETEQKLPPEADLTYASGNGTEQVHAALPMANEDGDEGLSGKFARGKSLYLSAQKAKWDGPITCRITVDDVVVSENTSSGKYGVVTCKATA